MKRVEPVPVPVPPLSVPTWTRIWHPALQQRDAVRIGDQAVADDRCRS